ncbi:hypothetical protein JXR93_13155 [bacterium]|nr:hypothetical protein [bacterium]
MNSLDVTAMVVFTETAMEKTPEYFDEADREQLKVVKEAVTLYLDEKNKKEISKAVLSIISVDKKKLLLKINIIATDIHNHLKKHKLTSRIATYFGSNTPSRNTSTESRAFSFIIKCYDKMTALGENSDILKFKDEIISLYTDVSKIISLQKENRLTEITTISERDSLLDSWYKEFKILSCMIEIKSIRFGFDKKNYIKKILLRKTIKTQEKVASSEIESE